MSKVIVYDLPTRAFHLMFGTLFIISFLIGKFVDDDSMLYAYHMLSGMLMLFLVVLRVIWGVVGSKYARFSSFNFCLKDLKQYFQNVLKGSTKRELGHNPASSYASIIMFALVIFLVLTGILMVTGIAKEIFEEIHELFGMSFLLIVILHILGLMLHELRHQDGMIFSMFNGTKDSIEGQNGISKNHFLVLILFLVISFSFTFGLIKNFNTENGTFSIGKKSFQLVKVEDEFTAQYYNDYYDMDNKDE